MDLNPFKKKKKEAPQGQEGEKPVAKVDVFPTEGDLEIQVRQKEKGQKVDIEREPVRGGVSRPQGSDFDTSARIRELLFNPNPESLEMLTVTKKQHWIALTAEETFDDVRSRGSNRRNGNYVSVARLFITHLDRRAISVQGNVSETRNAMLQVHQDMVTEKEGGRQMPMG